MWKSLCCVKPAGILSSSCTVTLFVLCWVSHLGVSNPSPPAHLEECHYSIHQTISRVQERDFFCSLFKFLPFLPVNQQVTDSTLLARDQTEKLSQYPVMLLEYKTIKASIKKRKFGSKLAKNRRQQKNWYAQRKLQEESSPNLSVLAICSS